MLAAARGYHRREDKPFWWAHFDRLNNPVDEWARHQRRFPRRRRAEVVSDWHLPSSRARKQQRWVKLTEHAGAGELTAACTRSTTRRRPPGSADNPTGARAVTPRSSTSTTRRIPTEVIDLRTRAQGRRTVHAGAVRADARAARSRRSSCGTPSTPRPPTSQPRCPTLPDSAIVDILLRRTRAPAAAHRCRIPATTSRGHHGRAARPGLVVPRGARAARHRQDVHARPGSSRRLVNDHQWRVGVVGAVTCGRWRTCSAT